jgi:cytochrome c oxidase subunit 1
MDSTVHNTQWITGHFHLIFGGAIVIMYFVIAYDLWPQLTGRELGSLKLVRTQLWLWFIGMMVLTMPWHLVGLQSMPRRMAYFDYTDPSIHPFAVSVILSVIGGALLVVSGALFIWILARARTRAESTEGAYRYSVA